MSRGWVYVLDNPSMPGKVKIGFTERIPDIRASELDATGVPTPFDLQFTALVDRAFELEQAVHASMDVNRVRQNREWFDLTVHEAIKAIKSSASAMDLELLFEDDCFSDEQEADDEEDSYAERFAASILKNNPHRALNILKSILTDSPEYTEEFFSELRWDSYTLGDVIPIYKIGENISERLVKSNTLTRKNEELVEAGWKRAAKILEHNTILEELIFNLLFEKFLPKTTELSGRIFAIEFFWTLFPRRRPNVDRLIDEDIKKLYSCDLITHENVWQFGSFAQILVERDRVDKAIEILQLMTPIICEMKYTKYNGASWGIVLPIGAILSTSGSTKLLDAIITQLLKIPIFVNSLVKDGFPEKYKYSERRIILEKFDINNIKIDKDGFGVLHNIYKDGIDILAERILSTKGLRQVKYFLTLLANNKEWRCLTDKYISFPLSDDAIYEQVAKEITSDNIKQGLWTKAYALANGDEKITKAQYIKLRVEQLTRNDGGR